MREAPRPLVADHSTDPPGPEPSAPPVVVGWDGDPASVAALRFAADLASRIGARLDVVHIEDLVDTPIDPDGDDWEDALDARLDDLSRSVKHELLVGVPAGWTYHVARGEAPARLLLRVAEQADAYAVVLGSPHGGVRGVVEELFGSRVARGVLARNRILPLVFVPARDGL
ncbi:universal stress protein [Tsukamurella sp. 8F]|uniref:universal stress protein n=1 Tax=unclassified Tsukamurella TaxID=2633480 RepID=UPI0023B92779|nr:MULTISPECIES: universal stress protein [unclassified Tsukamurella]MDF0531773.1 universal stress protein [Tsukamurella sp. 8J]MDF0588025.1 universal stress protein [Tsukamurella sp. 8F]